MRADGVLFHALKASPPSFPTLSPPDGVPSPPRRHLRSLDPSVVELTDDEVMALLEERGADRPPGEPLADGQRPRDIAGTSERHAWAYLAEQRAERGRAAPAATQGVRNALMDLGLTSLEAINILNTWPTGPPEAYACIVEPERWSIEGQTEVCDAIVSLLASASAEGGGREQDGGNRKAPAEEAANVAEPVVASAGRGRRKRG